MVANPPLQLSTKSPGYWIRQIELQDSPSCTFTEIDRLPLRHLSRKKNGKYPSSNGIRYRSFFLFGRKEVRFRKPAVFITIYKNSKSCFVSISKLFSQSNWNAKSSLGNVRKEHSTGSRIRIGACNSLILSMHRFFTAGRN